MQGGQGEGSGSGWFHASWTEAPEEGSNAAWGASRGGFLSKLSLKGPVGTNETNARKDWAGVSKREDAFMEI